MTRRLLFCASIATLSSAGCSGSQSIAPVAVRPSATPAPSATPTSSPTATPVAGSTLAPSISGVVSYPGGIVVPAGTHITVTGPTTLVSGGNIELDGTLNVAATGSLAIFASGTVTLDGSIAYATPAPSAAALHPNGSGRDASPAPSSTPIPTPSPLTIDAGSITYNGKTSTAITLRPSQDLDFADTTGTGTLTVLSTIALPQATASLTSPLVSGSIEFGSTKAIAATLVSAKAAGISKTATSFGTIVVGGFLVAGAGYDGFSDPDGVYGASSRTYFFSATNAGNGGNVDLAAGTINILAGFDVIGGAGGCGGAIGAVEELESGSCTISAPYFSQTLDGVNDGDPGTGIKGSTGSGGSGGDVFTSGTLTLAPAAQLLGGAFGERGLLENVYPGNGGGGGNGGSIDVRFGSDGCQGEVNGVKPACAPYDFSSPIYQLDGGGNAGAGGNTVGGGIGGSFTLRDYLGNPFKPPAGSFAIELSNSGNGGGGQNGCQGVKGSPGGSGGAGGTLYSGAVNYSLTASFNGGQGGPGVPGGAGGSGGIDDTGHSIGKTGPMGGGCS